MNPQPFEDIACNLCGGTDVVELFPSNLPNDLSLAVTKRFAPADHASGHDRIVRCRRCCLVFASPRMKEEYIWQGYSDADDQKYATQEKDRLRTFQRAVQKITSYVPQKGTLLDVGCAAGFFLKVAQDDGWKVLGIEPNKGLAALGSARYHIPIQSVKFLSCGLQPGSIDVITFWDVLEHVTDPKAYIQEAYHLLKPGGYIFVNFPDFGCPLARMAGQRWWFLSPVHIYYFTRKTLSRYLQEQYFEVVGVERHFQTLSIGYLFERFEPYSPAISRLGKRLTHLLRVEKLPLKYYASQALAIARTPLR